LKKNILKSILVTFLLTSCVITFDFEGFSDSTVLSWIPYKTNDVISYTNSVDTLRFRVNNDYITPKSKKTKGLIIMDPPYYPAYAYYKSAKESKTGLIISEFCEQECYLSIRFIDNDSIQLPYNYLKTFKSDTTNTDLKIIYHDKLSLNKIEYKDVYEIKKDTTDTTVRIWRVIITQNYGVLLFDDRTTNKTWTLID